jgi:hypothetical protein
LLIPFFHFLILYFFVGARGSIVDWDTMVQARRSRDRVPMRWILTVYLILPAAL